MSHAEGFVAAEQQKNQPKDDDDDDDSPSSRFTTRLLRFLLKGFLAKDKTVRYRVVHLVAEMVSSLGEIEYVSPITPVPNTNPL